MTARWQKEEGALQRLLQGTRQALHWGQWMPEVRVADGHVPQFLEHYARRHHGIRRVEVPSEPLARARFVRDWHQRQQRRLQQGMLAGVLVLPLLAQGAETGSEARMVALESIDGLVDWVEQEDDGLSLILRQGRVVELGPEQVMVDGEQIRVAADALIARGVPHQAVGAEQTVALTEVEGVRDAQLNPDGSVLVTLDDGVRMRLDPGAVQVVDGVPHATAAQLLRHGLVDDTTGGGAGGSESWLPSLDPTFVAMGAAGIGGIALALGSSSSSDDSQGPTQPQFSSSGYVIDGYLAGATVTRGSAREETNDQGFFDDLGGSPDQPIVVRGGVDLATGQNFTGVLSAPGVATVVTPVTSLVQAAIEAGASPQEAVVGVTSRLGLDASLANPDGARWLLDFDPVAALEEGGETAEVGLATLKAGVQIASLLQVAAQGDAEVFVELLGALGQRLLADAFDFTSDEDVGEFLTSAGVPGSVVGQAGALAAANGAIAAADSLQALASVQQALLQDVPGIVPEGSEPPPTPVLGALDMPGARALEDGWSLAVNPAEGESAPDGARVSLWVTDSAGQTLFANSALAEDGSATLTLSGADLARLVPGALSLQAVITAPGLAQASEPAAAETRLDLLLEVNQAVDGGEMLAALELLTDLELLALDGLPDQDALVAADVLAARPDDGFTQLSTLNTLADAVLSAHEARATLLTSLNDASQTDAWAAPLESLEAALQAMRSAGADVFAGDDAAALQTALAEARTQLADLTEVQTSVLEGLFSQARGEASGEAFDDLAAALDALSAAAQQADGAEGVQLALVEDSGADATDGISRQGDVEVTGLLADFDWEYSLDGGDSWIEGAGSSLVLSEGDYPAGTVQVRQLAGDAVLQDGTLPAVVIDQTPPSAPELATLAGHEVADAAVLVSDADRAVGVRLTGTAEAGSDVSVAWDGVTRSVRADDQGRWQLVFETDAIPASDGDYSLTVTATDRAGNASDTVAQAVDVDSSAVAVAIGAVAEDDRVNGEEAAESVTLTGSSANLGAAGQPVEWQLLDASDQPLASGTTSVDAQGNWSASVDLETLALADGEYRFQATGTAVGGATTSAQRTFVLDTTAPEVTVSGFADGADSLALGALATIIEAGEAMLAGSADAGSGQPVTVSLAGQSWQGTVSSGAWSVALPASALLTLSDGSHELTVTATDIAGNTAAPVPFEFEMDRLGSLNAAIDGTDLTRLVDDLALVLDLDLAAFETLGTAHQGRLLDDLLANRPEAGFDEPEAVVELFANLSGYYQAVSALQSQGVAAFDPEALASVVARLEGLEVMGRTFTADDVSRLDAGLAELAALQETAPSQFEALAGVSLALAMGASASELVSTLDAAATSLGDTTLSWQGTRIDGGGFARTADVLGAMGTEARQTVLDNFEAFNLELLAAPLPALRTALFDGLLVELDNTDFPPGSLVYKVLTRDLLEDARDDELTQDDFAAGGRIDQLREGLELAESQGMTIGFAGIELSADQLQDWMDAFNAFGDAGQDALLSAIDATFVLDLAPGVLADVNAAGSGDELDAALTAANTAGELLDQHYLPETFPSSAARDDYVASLLELKAEAGGAFADFNALASASEAAYREAVPESGMANATVASEAGDTSDNDGSDLVTSFSAGATDSGGNALLEEMAPVTWQVASGDASGSEGSTQTRSLETTASDGAVAGGNAGDAMLADSWLQDWPEDPGTAI